MPVPTKRDLIAQWAFDTRPLLLRFHLWLEEVEVEWLKGDPERGFDELSFVPGRLRRCLAMTAGLTALGTRLFGRFGDGRGQDKQTLNEVKKDADAVSAYVMSESLWHFSRGLPENHAIMVSLGEGLMPKAGESPEMGANPLLGFGRVYARPGVAKFIDARVQRLLNDPGYGWAGFYKKMRERGLTIWGAAVDTLENTSRFAKGEELGPMAVLHLFDQPMAITRPYEAYMGALTLPRSVVEGAEEQSIRVDLLTPRHRLVEAIESTLPGIRREHIHVWTLGGKSREQRLGALWKEWRELGVHLVEDGWICPSGLPAFTESGTYAPTYLVGTWQDGNGSPHVFLCDGYAASAEAVQAASLAQALDVEVSLALFSPLFELPLEREQRLGRLDPEAHDFEAQLGRLFGGAALTNERVALYRRSLRDMAQAHLPLGRRALHAGDFFPEKTWSVLAALGYMGPDPYSGLRGVERVEDDTWRVTTQLAAGGGRQRVSFSFRFLESFEQTRLVFSPLLERFVAGESYRTRAVKISDSGRIRNELQTLCSQALEYTRDHRIRVHFERIDDLVISAPRKRAIREVLGWYAANHPVWFRWLEIA
jgi:hypothetical protein